MPTLPCIFEFTDYRAFLNCYYRAARSLNPKFSHRYFAMKAGFSSSGLFSNILKGRRNLTAVLISKFAKALKLKKNEAAYFENLVHFNQAKTVEEKDRYYGRMLALSPVETNTLQVEQYEFFNKWWHTAIRELLNFYSFQDDFTALAKRLNPAIRPDQARSSIKMLEKLKLIRKNRQGQYRQTQALLSTGKTEEHSLHVANYQKETIDLAKQAIDRHPKHRRNISTLTLTLSGESFKRAQMEIEALQSRLMKMAEEDKQVDRVYQANFQLFPLTRF